MNHPLHSFLPGLRSTAGNAETASSEQPLAPRQAISQLLNLEGCAPRLDDDGDIRFDHDGIHYLLLFSEADPEYMRLVLPSFFAIDNESERAIALSAANATNSSCKAAKVFIDQKQTHAVIECFLSSQAQLVPVLMRCLSALEHAARSFAMAYALQRSR